MAGFPFVLPFADSQLLTFGGFKDAVVNATAGAPVGAWMPPSAFTLQQFRFSTPNFIVGVGTITGSLVTFDLDTGALVNLGSIILDATHNDGTLLFNVPITMRQSLAVVVSGGGGLAGGHLVIAGVAGSIGAT